ncbi:MAG: hypothetical protein ACOC8P_00375 [Dichotomicrobium sp.]
MSKLPPGPWKRQQFSSLKDELVAANGRVVCQVHVRRETGVTSDEKRIEADPVGEAVIEAIQRLGGEA